MKTIIAEKPSVAREIARIVGATQREERYITGNGYYVTWAFGHLVQLAMPEAYGFKGFQKESLPILPDVFQLTARQSKGGKGYAADPGVEAQIRCIGKLFADSEYIIVATDAGREGELIFRYLYNYIGCSTPFKRLWISSLTDKAIREGLRNLEDGSKYDNLYLAAKARSEADWLVGINATQAITIAAGRGTYSLGRVQTPTLAMVCDRYWKNKRFTPEAFWQLHFATGMADGGTVKLSSVEKWKDKAEADTAYTRLKAARTATVDKVERKEKTEEPPLLYDLTSLQKEANAKHGFTADQTLQIAQKLYESKIITYPRTGSSYIPEDVFAEIPSLLLTLQGSEKWGTKAMMLSTLSRHSVDDSKVTDHHALLITGEKPALLSKDEMTVYDMIVGRMIEAFAEKCVKEVTSVIATAGDMDFSVRGSVMKQKGWRFVYGDDADTVLPDWKEGESLKISGASITEGKTKPQPLHTEATLLAAMETCGKEIEDETLRQAIKDCGIGTPATRASIIETLFARGYVERVKKSLVPTEKGLALYSVVKDMSIADVTMTGEWEKSLAQIEHGEMAVDEFNHGIEQYTVCITSELLSSDKLFAHKSSDCLCPKCGTGHMQFLGKVVRCDNPDCGLPLFRQKAGRLLTDAEVTKLIQTGATGVLRGFKSKQGKSFDANVVFDSDFNTVFVFPEAKNGSKRPKSRK
ncbi:MAG: topoisomerase C-terminal repeat-containing protein [Bacteroidaceae bacterium]|nr:topoisomerase C-terminal repeat-containing protein [Bacteroidaceae bacterium]MBQ8969661.1 topoisomerase C-terminal repeat-containing protein [Bacteroidaceae bacterium]